MCLPYSLMGYSNPQPLLKHTGLVKGHVHFVPGKIMITLELLCQFLRFLDQNDRHSLGILLIY